MTREEALEVFNHPTAHFTDEREEAIRVAIDAIEKLEDLKWLVESYPIRADHYDTKNGNKAFVLGAESMREYVLDVLNGEISVD